MAFWITELPGGGFAMGEARDEREARLMIESQQRGSVTWNERAERYRWTVVLDGGKTSHGWADSERDAWEQVKEVVNRPYRGTNYRGPWCLWSLPPA
jgi:hypothetical protein